MTENPDHTTESMAPLTALVAAQVIAENSTRDTKASLTKSLGEHAQPEQMVKTFHMVYGLPTPRSPIHLSVSRRDLRLKLILEEFQELVIATGFKPTLDEFGNLTVSHVEGSQQDHIEMMDALADIVYVCYGMAIEMGQALTPVFREVHAANMTKLGLDGNPIINGVTPGYEGDHAHPELADAGFRMDLPIGKVLKGPNTMKPQLARILQMPADNIHTTEEVK